jgi:hypothetical protein
MMPVGWANEKFVDDWWMMMAHRRRNESEAMASMTILVSWEIRYEHVMQEVFGSMLLPRPL